MDKVKRYLLYIILIILLAVISKFLISVGLNSTYKPMEQDSSSKIEQVNIYQAEATRENGRIRGVIKNSNENKINAKYLKIELYTPRDVEMGSEYIEINQEMPEQLFEVFFEKSNVTKYKMSFVNEK